MDKEEEEEEGNNGNDNKENFVATTKVISLMKWICCTVLCFKIISQNPLINKEIEKGEYL